MDPDANLAEQRALAATIISDDGPAERRVQDGERLAELVEALDEWITSGGFLPTEWRMAQERATAGRRDA